MQYFGKKIIIFSFFSFIFSKCVWLSGSRTFSDLFMKNLSGNGQIFSIFLVSSFSFYSLSLTLCRETELATCGCFPLITHFYWAISRLPRLLGEINAIFPALTRSALWPPSPSTHPQHPCLRQPTPWGRNVAPVGEVFKCFLLFGAAWIHS